MLQATLLVAFVAVLAGAAALEDSNPSSSQAHDPFDADDECSAAAALDGRSTSECALNALQRSGLKAHALRIEKEATVAADDEQQSSAEEQSPDNATADSPTIEAKGWGGSCAAYGCGGYVSWHRCQCNSGCGRHNNCCWDYKAKCTHHKPPPPPAPRPHPGPACTASWSYNCLSTKKCCDPSKTCYEKNAGWAACLDACSPGIHWNEPAAHRSPWSCKPVSGGYHPPAPLPPAPPPPTCSQSYSHNCMLTKKCCQAGFTCYMKNSGWASCLPSCAPGVHWTDPPSQRTPWACTVVGPVEKPPAPLPITPPPTPAPTIAPTLPPTLPPAPPEPLPPSPAPVTETVTAAPSSSTTSSEAPAGPSWYNAHHPEHAQPSNAPLVTFYMYRTQNDQEYPPMNQNLANAAGTLWYLHNEIVWHIPRRFGKTRVQRYKVQSRAPQALYNKGMNFGVRVAFDSGRCTGPYWRHSGLKTCAKDWDTYGFFIGCNNVGLFPTYQWHNQVHYKNAIWYSLPGECPDNYWNAHNATCQKEMPGGKCPPGVTPTGEGDCTYNFEPAGEISLDALDGIGSYWPFIYAGGKEYDQKLDRGVHNDFWDFKSSDYACDLRLQAFVRMFHDKYPDDPKDEDLSPPPCDFNEYRYYS